MIWTYLSNSSRSSARPSEAAMKLPTRKKIGLKNQLTLLTTIPHVLAIAIVMLTLANVEIAHKFLFVLLVVVLSSSILSVMALKRIMRPFNELVINAKGISQREFKRPVDKDTEDDLESLSNVFNDLIKSFQQYRNEMERGSSELSDVNRQMLNEIVQRKRTEKRLQYLVEFIKIITHLSSTFIMISSTEVMDWLHRALQAIGEVLGADRGYIVILTQGRDEVADVFEWQHAHQSGTVMKDISMSSLRGLPWLMKSLEGFENIYVENIAYMPQQADAERDFFEARSICSFVAVPMVYGNHLVGFLGFDSSAGQKSWAEDVIALVRVGGEIFVNALERAKNDRELSKYRSHLEDLVNQRTGELTAANEMLLQEVVDRKEAEDEAKKAKEVAEEANRAKGVFLTNMTHELRTPLNGVIGMTDLMLNTLLLPQQQEYLELIKNASNNLLSLLNTIIDFSNTETCTMHLNNSSFILSDTINTALEPLIQQAERAGIRIASTIAGDIPEALTGDHAMLKNVLTYIAENAMKFTPRGQISITVTPALYDISSHTPVTSLHPRDNGQVERSNDKHIMLLFSVRDTGIGIAAEKLRVIFDSFTQVDGSMTRKYGGMGLGLAIAKRLINMMNGEIWVESVLGKGSTFQFTAWFTLNADVNLLSVSEPSSPPEVDSQEQPSMTAITEDNDKQANPGNWEVFVGNYALELENLKNAIDKKDITLVERYAHALKDIFTQVGVTTLKNDAFRIELASRKKDMTKVETAFNNLKDGYAKASRAASYNDYLKATTEDKT
ncbi:MAG: GAF domain-containing protein [Nitrospirae bacterium]|nr:GAF domain-containing protein [Nitrospirota bacterium]